MRKSAFWANRRQMEACAWGGQAAIHLDTRGWSSAQCASIPWTLRLCWRPQCAHAWGGYSLIRSISYYCSTYCLVFGFQHQNLQDFNKISGALNKDIFPVAEANP